jgi:hypothetical protein
MDSFSKESFFEEFWYGSIKSESRLLPALNTNHGIIDKIQY